MERWTHSSLVLASTKIFVDTTNDFVVCSFSMKQPPHKPTASELEILRVLWTRGPSTVREVHESLSEKKELGYTTVLKLLQIMTTKGTVKRNETQRAHVYEACLPAEQTKRQLAGDMLQRVFEGSASQLMMHALAGTKASQQEIEELRHLLDEYERSRR
jgi:BlaI family transcriptional regulator, penicillinase repressor